MNETEIKRIRTCQKEYFQTGATLPVARRLAALYKLKLAIQKYEQELLGALTADLGKSSSEGYMCEVGLTLSEISYMQKQIQRFAKEKRIMTPMAH